MPNDAVQQMPTFDDQIAEFKAFATTDGEISDGKATPEENAALAARESDQSATDNLAGEGAAADEAVGEGEQTAEQKAAANTKKPKKTATERIAEIGAATREMREAERRLAEREATIQARLDALEKRGLTESKQEATKDPNAAPKPDDFEYGELDSRYIEAKIQHGVKAALAAAKAEDETKRQAEAATAKQTELQTKYQAFEAAGTEKYDDFQEVVIDGARSGAWKPTPAIGELILGSEVGPDVAYHIASNPKEWAAVSGKSPLEQAAYFGRLEAKFSSASDASTGQSARVQTTRAPTPVKPVRGAGTKTSFDPATATFEQFEAHARATQT